MRGWALADQPIRRIAVELADGSLVGTARLACHRPDVGAAFPDRGADRSGFELEVSGAHVRSQNEGDAVTVVATLGDGRRLSLPPAPLSSPVLGRVDEVSWDALPSRTLVVRGWAHQLGGLVVVVEPAIASVALGRAGLGRLRPDVAADLDEPDAELSGFELAVDTSGLDLPAGPASVHVLVRTAGGRATTLELVDTSVPRVPSPAAFGPGTIRTPSATRSRPRGRARVLWFARHLDAGGSQLRMLEQIRQLAARDRTTHTVVAPGDGGLASRLQAAGADVVLVPPVPFDDRWGYDLRVRELTAWASGRFDVVVGFTLTSFPGIEVAGNLGLPSLWRIGEAKPLHEVARWFGRPLDPEVDARARAAAGSASVIVHVSRATERTFTESGYQGRSVVVHTGVDLRGIDDYLATSDRDEVRRALGFGADSLVYVNAASVWPVKGQAPFAAVIERVTRGRAVRCVFLGAGLPEYRDALVSMLRRRGRLGEIEVRPFVDDVRPWWRAADVAVCSSETEALPSSVIEAMAFGLPVLASDAGGLGELVLDGDTGWSYEANDLASAGAAIEASLAASPIERRRRGAAGRALVERHHDGGVQATRFAELVEGLGGWVPQRPLDGARRT